MVSVQRQTGGIRILAVVVVHKLQPAQSTSMQTLLQSAATPDCSAMRLSINIADNTPGGQLLDPLPPHVQYRPYPDNPGLARPYNDALTQANAEGYTWLLTLDQDTCLPQSFLADMATIAAAYEDDPSVAAIVPRILDQGRLVSPFRFAGGWLPLVLPPTATGKAGPHLSALNSASLLKVQALRDIGGYDEAFPLHNSDTRLYGKLDAAGKRAVVAGNIVVPHELSILNREDRISPQRYRTMLEDECVYWDRHMGPLARAERLGRLVLRYVKGTVQGEAAAYRNVTLAEIRRRLTTSHQKRIARTAAERSQPPVQ